MSVRLSLLLLGVACVLGDEPHQPYGFRGVLYVLVQRVVGVLLPAAFDLLNGT